MIQLQPGTILDERYRIQKTLGEGGFGITYAAENTRIGIRVAVKEFYWRGYVKREEKEDGSCLIIAADPADAENFRLMKDRFLQEARILRDFERENAIVHILDYFEANGTAYMVMEYLEGETLRSRLKTGGVFEPETLFRKMLPIVSSLSNIHDTGIIHRDISPDNIMVLEDGSFKLLDFGAARKYRDVAGGQYTAIARDSYAPGEQYDRNGNQGPWTDVYALCATMYECVTAKAPDSAVQRMFLDELKAPSGLGIRIEKPYETVIMKGLSMEPEARWPSMEALRREMEAALPAPVPEEEKKKKIRKRILLPAAAAAALVIGLTAYHQYDITHKFRNVETETFVLYAPPQMTAEDFALEQERVEKELAEFAGADNYELDVDGSAIHVLLPLSCFQEQEINTVIEERILEDSLLGYEAEIKADWEDADRSVLAGENQCRIGELTGVTVTQVFACESDYQAESLTKGEWSNLVTDMKVRLDALDTPYAFGTLYGNGRKIVVSLAAEKTGQAVNLTLGERISFSPRGNWETGFLDAKIEPSVSSAEILPADDGTYALRISPEAADSAQKTDTADPGSGAYALKIPDRNQKEIMIKMAGTLSENGEDRVYLFGSDAFFASGSLGSAQEDGVLVFDTFYLPESTKIGEDRLYFLEYLCALLNETSVPVDYTLQNRNFRDENGSLLLRFDGSTEYGLNLTESPPAAALQKIAEQMQKDGYEVISNAQDKVWLMLEEPADTGTLKEVFAEVKNLCSTYQLVDSWGTFWFIADAESGNTALRVEAGPDDESYRGRQIALILPDDADEEFRKEAEQLWNRFAADGFTKVPYGEETDGEG